MKNNEHLDNLLPIVREKLNLSNEDRKEFILGGVRFVSKAKVKKLGAQLNIKYERSFCWCNSISTS